MGLINSLHLFKILLEQQWMNYQQKWDQKKKNKTDRPELDGRGIDIHNAILKVAPNKGLVVPGHNYTGPGNPLEDQLRHDSEGNILEIYQQPTGPTDAVSMQHDFDYSVCGNKPKSEQVKCKMKLIEKW